MTLQPDFHFLEVAYPYVARRLLTDDDPSLRNRLIQVWQMKPILTSFFVCSVLVVWKTCCGHLMCRIRVCRCIICCSVFHSDHCDL